MHKYPHIQQQEEKDCGAACLSMISEYFGLKLSISFVRELIRADSYGSNIYGIIQGAEKIHISGTALEGSCDELMEGIVEGSITLPFIARIVNEAAYEHFIVVYRLKPSYVIIGDPAKDKNTRISLDFFCEQWLGQIVTFIPDNEFVPDNRRKGTLSRYVKMVTCQKKKLTAVFMLSVFTAIVNIGGAALFGYLADSILRNFSSLDLNVLNLICLVILGIYIVLMLSQFLRNVILTYLVKNVDFSISSTFFKKLCSLPQELFERYKTGALLSRFDDAINIRDTVSNAVITIMLDTLIAAVTGIYLFILNRGLFCISLIIIGIYAILVSVFRRPIKHLNQQLMEQDAVITSLLKEMIDGMETLKAYNSEHKAFIKMNKQYQIFLSREVKENLLSGLLNTLSGGASSIGILSLMWAGIAMCIHGTVSFGALVSFYYLLGYFFDPVQNLIDLLPTIQRAMVAAERLNDIIDAEEEPDNKTENITLSLTEGIRFKNISFRYGYRHWVLDSVSFVIPKGKKVAFVGMSGSGKTTIAKLLIKMYRPESGDIFIDHIHIDDIKNKELRKKIVYVPQYSALFSESVYNNLRAGNNAVSNNDIERACKVCLADEFINNLPFGYNTVLEENGKNLSTGQRQRLALARALLKTPQVLILDEATSNLDEEMESKVFDRIIQDRDLTCIIITHRDVVQQRCDYIYKVQDGKVIHSH